MIPRLKLGKGYGNLTIIIFDFRKKRLTRSMPDATIKIHREWWTVNKVTDETEEGNTSFQRKIRAG